MDSVGLQAGRELDALVAWKVMGQPPSLYHQGPFTCDIEGKVCCANCGTKDDFTIPVICPSVPYSTSIAAAWEVIEQLPTEWWLEVGRRSDGSWYCEICRGGDVPMAVGPPIRMVADTAPLAICLAALKVGEQNA